MLNVKVGDRVGAVLQADAEAVWLFGYGVYIGDEVPPPTAIGFNIGLPNPKLVMDEGEAVFGCECWWGLESKVKKKFAGRKVIRVDVEEMRAAEARRQAEEQPRDAWSDRETALKDLAIACLPHLKARHTQLSQLFPGAKVDKLLSQTRKLVLKLESLQDGVDPVLLTLQPEREKKSDA